MPLDSELLGRIDERTLAMAESMDKLERRMVEGFVTKEEFKPVKAIAYGFAGLLLTTVVAAGLTLVIQTAPK